MTLTYLFLALLTSCAWSNKKIVSTEKEEDISRSFEIDSKLKEKFFFQKKPSSSKETLLTKKEIKPKNKKTQRFKKKNFLVEKKEEKTKKKPITKQISQSKENRPLTKIANIPFKKSISYPKDYPKKYIEYNNKFQKTWDYFSPVLFENERIIMDIKYFGITCGKVTITTMPNKNGPGPEQYHLFARMKSAPFYQYIYTVNDYIETYIKKDSFLPLKYTLVQRESAQQVDDLQLFDHDLLKTFFWYKRIKKNRNKQEKKVDYIPRFYQDSFSGLYFVRGLQLNIGAKYEFPIITRAKLWILKLEVLGKEKVKVKNKTYSAIKIKAVTQYPGVLKKRGDIFFWFSDDKYRIPIKFEAKVKIGTIEGVLSEYTPGKM